MAVDLEIMNGVWEKVFFRLYILREQEPREGIKLLRENIWREKIRESFPFINRELRMSLKQRRESNNHKVENQENVAFHQTRKESFECYTTEKLGRMRIQTSPFVQQKMISYFQCTFQQCRIIHEIEGGQERISGRECTFAACTFIPLVLYQLSESRILRGS